MVGYTVAIPGFDFVLCLNSSLIHLEEEVLQGIHESEVVQEEIVDFKTRRKDLMQMLLVNSRTLLALYLNRIY